MALKLLARPETYLGSLPDIQEMVRNTETLMGEVEDGCFVECSPAYVLEIATYRTPYDSTMNYVSPIENCAGCGGIFSARAGSVKKILSGICRYAFEFFEVGSGVSVGMNVCRIEAHETDQAVAPVWTLEWVDCLGATHIVSDVGQLFARNNIVARRMCITSDHPFALWYSWSGEIQCTSA